MASLAAALASWLFLEHTRLTAASGPHSSLVECSSFPLPAEFIAHLLQTFSQMSPSQAGLPDPHYLTLQRTTMLDSSCISLCFVFPSVAITTKKPLMFAYIS